MRKMNYITANNKIIVLLKLNEWCHYKFYYSLQKQLNKLIVMPIPDLLTIVRNPYPGSFLFILFSYLILHNFSRFVFFFTILSFGRIIMAFMVTYQISNDLAMIFPKKTSCFSGQLNLSFVPMLLLSNIPPWLFSPN